jgi:hypothetical protein
MRHATRDLQRVSTMQLTNDIALGLSANNRRLCLIETHVSRMINRNTNSAAPKTDECAFAQTENDRTSYWHQTASTLSKENAELVCRISRYEEQINRHREALKRLSRAKIDTESELAAANREIMRLTMCGNSIVLPTAAPVRLQSIQVSTQGKDAHYWYQTCRTMEAQFIQKTTELQAVIDTLIEAAASQHRTKPS